MRDRLEELFRHVSVGATADREHEAVIELLLLVMMIDGRVSSDEMDEIRAITKDQGMETDTFSFEQHLGEASAKVRAALAQDNGVAALLDDISSRVSSRVLRASMLAAARDVAAADERLEAGESELLAQVAARFA
jgi:uncharacterized tellurite resistance protein B-like protein